jgi:multidrug transporter EmrE-like cation transporter
VRPLNLLLLGIACSIFLGAASSAKAWALAPSLPKVALTLGLYTLGNLIMLFLVREVGMATAFSLSAVLQLVAVNLVALLVFGERVGTAQGIGLALAILAVALITLGPHLRL